MSDFRISPGNNFKNDWTCLDPALLEGIVNDGALDVLDGDRRGVDAQHAGALTGRGTHPACTQYCGYEPTLFGSRSCFSCLFGSGSVSVAKKDLNKF